ncbi:MAG TPA: RDD family protein [Candidatus Eremiobacteraceae bacterium]|nr:RDD family protein [Candidatus Eremiobacteraceae bacterium]
MLDRPAAESTPEHSAHAASTLPPEARQIFPGPPPPVAPDHGDVGAYIVRRTLALLVDIVFVGMLIAMAARVWITRASNGELSLGGFLQLALVVAIALFAYRWLFSGILGSTPGKLLFGLVVGRNGGGRAGLGRTFVRELILPLDLVVIGFLLAALLPRRQRVGDLVAGTVVVNSKLGAIAPLLGIVMLGGAGYATLVYAGGVAAAQRLATDASHYANGLITRSSPLPSATSAPTPIETIPLVTPSPEPSTTSNASPTVKPRPTPTPNPTPSTTV